MRAYQGGHQYVFEASRGSDGFFSYMSVPCGPVEIACVRCSRGICQTKTPCSEFDVTSPPSEYPGRYQQVAGDPTGTRHKSILRNK